MRVRDLGEFGLIARIERAAARLAGGAVALGIGDDAALLRPRAGEDVAVSSDAFVEDVHFRWSNESPRTVGRRALVANLSDLAAMGARPLGFTLSLVLPPDLAVSRVDGLVAGLLREADTFCCPLVGGNVSAGSETSLTISALGAVTRGRALTRAGARDGDRICVTGTLGRAALDRARAERGAGRVRHVARPRLAAGRALTRLRVVGGCIDVSDGVAADARHMLAGTGLVAALDPAAVPVPARFAAACARLGLDPRTLACSGGEDYELLVTVRSSGPSTKVLERRLGVPVSEIGRVRRARDREAGTAGGWTHF